MCRFFPLVAGLALAGSLRGDSPPSVADLVKQLGDAQFAKREVAQRELLKRGEGIVPELDRLSKGVDAETAERLRKIRYDLVGFLEDIRELLKSVDNRPDYVPDPIPPQLRDLIAAHQPRAGDFLLECAADARKPLYLRARRAFVQTWQSATADQLDRFIQLRVYLETAHRSKFPAKVGAMIPMEARIRDGWGGWFAIDGKAQFQMMTRTTRYLDGKPYDKPFEYQHPFATVGWYRVGELHEGKHTIHAVMEYEFTQNGVKRKGQIRSKPSEFEVVSADTPDTLIAPKSEARYKKVKEALESVGPKIPPPPRLPGTGFEPANHPVEIHVSWDTKPGKRMGLNCPHWHIESPLDVDLCFDVEIQDIKTGKVYPAYPIVLHKDKVGSGYIMPRNARAFAGDREGDIAVKVVRKPSRGLALTDPKITSYFPETIATEKLKIKIFKDIPALPLSK